MSPPALRLVPSTPDQRSVFDKVRDLIERQSLIGALSRAEAVGADWAIDTVEALHAIEVRRAAGEVLTDDDIHEIMFAVRGG